MVQVLNPRRNIDKFSPQQLAAIAWSYAMVNFDSPQLFAAVRDEATHKPQMAEMLNKAGLLHNPGSQMSLAFAGAGQRGPFSSAAGASQRSHRDAGVSQRSPATHGTMQRSVTVCDVCSAAFACRASFRGKVPKCSGCRRAQPPGTMEAGASIVEAPASKCEGTYVFPHISKKWQSCGLVVRFCAPRQDHRVGIL
jgi:hypothetical protein